jgi:hypothetical protein
MSGFLCKPHEHARGARDLSRKSIAVADDEPVFSSCRPVVKAAIEKRSGKWGEKDETAQDRNT